MINPQLFDYIRQQLAGGVSKEDTVEALLANNWSVQDINDAFAILEKGPSSPVIYTPMPSVPTSNAAQPKVVSGDAVNIMWAKHIPRANKIFMVISLLLVFGLDLSILIESPDLAYFWYVMLGVLAVFMVFYCLENFVFSKRFSKTTSSWDKWISMIIAVRNLVFLLNFIPYIQVLGMVLLGGFLMVIPGAFFGGSGGFGSSDFGGLGGIVLIMPGLLVLYIILVARRFSVTKQ